MFTPSRLVRNPCLRVLAIVAIIACPSPISLAQLSAQPASPLDERQSYWQHISFLANPFLEGRGPGTRGNELASEYVAKSFERLGLTPIIAHEDASVIDPIEGQRTWRQPFTAGTRATEKHSVLARAPYAGRGGDTFPHTPLGFSASAEASGPLVFVGYAIQGGGPDKSYNSFADTDDLKGKIAVVLRFEPMNEVGKSRWTTNTDTRWSGAAALSTKFQAITKRGAAGIILLSPAGADDPRAQRIETPESTARWMPIADIPVVMMTPEQGNFFLDGAGASLADLKRAADDHGGITPLGDTPFNMSVFIDRSPRTTWNVAGVLPGTGNLADQYVIIGAHYDHVGYGYTGGSRTDEYGIIHPGADDNASGTAGLLTLAESLAKKYKDDSTPRRSILFIAFSAEEMGLIGSRAFIKNSPVEASKITAMLNMDMIGRMKNDALELAGTGTSDGFDELLTPFIESSGLNVKRSPGGRGPSDHATFYGAGVPVLHFFTGLHDEYHTPRDTLALINTDGASRVVSLVSTIADALAHRPEQLVFKTTDKPRAPGEKPEAAGPSMANMKVRFGIAPGNYAEENEGVLVGEVFPGTSAAEAGIQKDDRLTRWNGEPIVDVAGWMGYLVKHNPGDTVDVTLIRGKEEIIVRVTLKTRDQAPR